MQIIELLVEVHVSILQLAQSTILYEKICPLKDSECEKSKRKKNPNFLFRKNNHSKSSLITQTHHLRLLCCLHSWCLYIVYLGSNWACAYLQNSCEEIDLGLGELHSHGQVQEG